MKLSMRLTMNGLVRAMRWKGLQAADLHQTRGMTGEGLEPVGSAAKRVVEGLARDERQ